MASLQATDIADLVQSIINDKGALKMTDNSSDYQSTHIVKRLFKDEMDSEDGGGTEFEFNVLTDTNGSARSVGMFHTTTVNPTNVLTSGKMGWRHDTYNWGYDHREIAMNSKGSKVVDLVQSRRIAAQGAWIKECERKGWRAPSSTSDDFMGIPYWVVKSNTAVTTNNGFNGTSPATSTNVGNINPNTYTRWRNYATQYTNITKDDLVDKMWRMADYCGFTPLVAETPEYNTGDDFGWFTTYAVRRVFKQILESQNDNLGFDLDPMSGKPMFRGGKVEWVIELDTDTTNPIYMLNFGVFKIKVLTGWYKRETTIAEHNNQPTVGAVHTHTTLNTICYDRRRNGVLATNTTMPA